MEKSGPRGPIEWRPAFARGRRQRLKSDILCWNTPRRNHSAVEFDGISLPWQNARKPQPTHQRANGPSQQRTPKHSTEKQKQNKILRTPVYATDSSSGNAAVACSARLDSPRWCRSSPSAAFHPGACRPSDLAPPSTDQHRRKPSSPPRKCCAKNRKRTVATRSSWVVEH